ncbi:hypothetical protein PHSY_004921 [Pseudozyma hubeiensis SY62]|uniref:Uncharacterized protein n=1 Tax=Pseudozyma hubeiensis (strain SY62) TaxID=1305764 RepID=R9P7M1_PSEHS|nr:hypothetical protein PHSY_004921 [Pseudozyma hubeiensis SY62]GAC97336.1 hypothetical protein PHSY_004921 [Pseudozyma hubeiensis SY62]
MRCSESTPSTRAKTVNSRKGPKLVQTMRSGKAERRRLATSFEEPHDRPTDRPTNTTAIAIMSCSVGVFKNNGG